MSKLVVNNGFLIDPKNEIYSKLNIGIENGLVVEISKEILEGDIVDIHMHEDNYDPEKDEFENIIFKTMVKMGVTTAIGGNCGVGPNDIEAYIDAINRLGLPMNLGLLLGHKYLRNHVGAKDKYASLSSEDISKMRAKAEEVLDLGLLGISFGIRYIPGINDEELIEVARACEKDGKIIAAHIRDDAEHVIDAVEEFIDIRKEVNAPLQVSHIGSMGAYGQMEELLKTIDDYRANGYEIGIDCYPYNAFSTSIGATTFDEGFLDRYEIDYSAIEIAQGKYKGQRCSEEIFKELREEAPWTLVIGHVMNEDDVDMALRHPNVVMASDGILDEGQGHPRAGGSFPRLINEYVKKKKILSLYEAIEKMTSKPASIMGINKGSLGIGDDGDMLIFDFNEIADKATFENPLVSPEGIKYVIINGQIAVKDNEILQGNLGRFVI